MLTTWLVSILSVVVAAADGVTLEFKSSGAVEKSGGYMPIRADFAEPKDELKIEGVELSAPKSGHLKLGDKNWLFVLDEPADQPAQLFIDSNGDGDLSNDPKVEWTSEESGGLKTYRGEAKIDLGDGRLGAIGLYRFDPSDKRRAALANTLLFYTDFGYEVKISLDGEEYSSFIAGEPSEKSRLWIDRDHNGKTSAKREVVLVNEPFNYTGTTYVLTLADGSLNLDKASEELPLTPLPPDLSVGKQAVEFTAKSTDDSEIAFPKTYADKIVLLDFWATWCGPCIAELPNVKAAYSKWHDHGFEVLGVSFDRPDMAEKLAEFTAKNEMPWQQIYEGKGWDTTLGESYDVSAIPFVLLVDGSTGEIIANVQTDRQLRGPGLVKYIGEVLKDRKGVDVDKINAEAEEKEKAESTKDETESE